MPRSPDRTRPPVLDHQQPRLPAGRARGEGDDDASSADELTGIVARGDRAGYQSIVTGRGSTGPAAAAAAEANGTGRLEDARQQGVADDVGEGVSAKEQGARRRRPWYKTMFDPFQSIELENKGSVARDHLAIGAHLPPPNLLMIPYQIINSCARHRSEIVKAVLTRFLSAFLPHPTQNAHSSRGSGHP
jgi:hypothetical protein